jgi:serine/threonine protein kinase
MSLCFVLVIRSSTSLKKPENKEILGTGYFGIVYEGTWNGRMVAVKRIQSDTTSNEREEEALKTLHHPNVVKLFHVEKDEYFK